MKLEEYLRGIRNCSDSDLYEEWGIGDNFPILLGADFDKVISHFRSCGKYEQTREINDSKGKKYQFNYIPGSIVLRVANYLDRVNTSAMGIDTWKQAYEEYTKQVERYKVTIVLHPYQGKVVGGEVIVPEKIIEGVSNRRALASVIEEIGEFAMSERIPLCLPGGIGKKYFGNEDDETINQAYTRTVYYEP